MRVAIDLQPNPTEVPKPLKASRANAVTLFYFLSLGLLGYAGIASAQRFKLEGTRAENQTQLAAANTNLESLRAEAKRLKRQDDLATDLSEWLKVTPPAQALTLLLTQEIEPNVAFSRLQIEMEQGQPNVKVTVELTTSAQDSASRQVLRIQTALEKAGLRTINVDTDSPTPEGWRFVALLALPIQGDFSALTR